jgi:sodium/potassium-transporting ATPase subunit alpha
VGVILINAFFSFWQSLRTERALEALEKLLPQSINVLRSKIWALRSAEEIVPGDVIEIREGERIGADVRLIESYKLRVDTSHLTGESIPAFRHAQADACEQTLVARNLLLTGMKVVAGRAKGIVFATGERTEFGKIAKLTLLEKPKQSPLQEQVKHTSQRIAALATLVGVLFFFAALATGLDTTSAMIFGIGLIVANIPEGLMPTLTMSLAIAAQRMAKKKPW